MTESKDIKDKKTLNETELKIFNQLLSCAFSYGFLDYERKTSGYSRKSVSKFDSNLNTADILLNMLGGSNFQDFILNHFEAFDEYLAGVVSYLEYCNIKDLPEDLNIPSKHQSLDIYFDEEEKALIINTIKENQAKEKYIKNDK